MDMESMYGVMGDNIKGTGSTIKCMEMDSINGKMVACMLDNINSIRNMDLVYIHGRMDANILDSGPIVNETVKVKSSLWMGLRDKDNGKKTKGLNGLMNPKNCGTPRTQKNIDL